MQAATDWLVQHAATPSGGVALAEAHGDPLAATLAREFVLAAPSGSSIVVEFLSARYQPRIDEFASARTPMPLDEVAPAWRDTTQDPLLWEQPGYLATLLAARDRRGDVRVIGAEPPVPWAEVTAAGDLLPLAAARTATAVAAVAAAASGPRLLWYGGWHLTRGNGGLIDQLDVAQTWSVGWVQPLVPLNEPDQLLPGTLTALPGRIGVMPFDPQEVQRRRDLINAMLHG